MREDRATISDVRSLQATLERQSRRQTAAEQENVIIDGARQLMLRSPNGHYWAITVDDFGALSTTDMGTSL